MGLDMYLRGEKFFIPDFKNPEKNRTEDGLKVSRLTVELGYWRKHPNLHGYFVQEFAQGVDNCQRIDLRVEDLEKTIKAVQNKELPDTQGFFFGKSDGSEAAKDEAILKKAIAWLQTQEAGAIRDVYYKASW